MAPREDRKPAVTSAERPGSHTVSAGRRLMVPAVESDCCQAGASCRLDDRHVQVRKGINTLGPMRRRRLSKLGGGGLLVAKCSSANRTQRLASCGAS